MLWNSTSIPLPSYVRDKSKDKYVSLQSFWPSNLLIMFEKKIYTWSCAGLLQSAPPSPLILWLLKKLGHLFIGYMKQFTYIHRKKKRKTIVQTTKKRANAYINFIHSYKTLHVYTPYTVKKNVTRCTFDSIFEMMSVWCSFVKTSNCDMTNQTILLRR